MLVAYARFDVSHAAIRAGSATLGAECLTDR